MTSCTMNINAVKYVRNQAITFQLLITLVSLADQHGQINIRLGKLAEYIRISRQCLSSYLHKFADSDILKYKYSGKGIFNPEFLHDSTIGDKQIAIELYKTFKSDF